MKPIAFNSVLPVKVYAVFSGSKKIGEVTADDIHGAFRNARLDYGNRCTSVELMLCPSPKPTT